MTSRAEAGSRDPPAKAVMRHQGCSEGFPKGRRPEGNPEEQPWCRITAEAEGSRVPAEALEFTDPRGYLI